MLDPQMEEVGVSGLGGSIVKWLDWIVPIAIAYTAYVVWSAIIVFE